MKSLAQRRRYARLMKFGQQITLYDVLHRYKLQGHNFKGYAYSGMPKLNVVFRSNHYRHAALNAGTHTRMYSLEMSDVIL